MYENLLNHLARYVQISADQQHILLSGIGHKKVSKKDFLLKEGQVCTANYFVLSGCFRLYLVEEGGTEQIIQFGIPDWWICDYQSLENKTPSGYFIQAVEDAEVAVIDRRNQDSLFNQIPQLERYFRIILQRAYSASLSRIQYQFCQSGEERYHQFTKAFPEFVQRVPQYMLASFLGLTPEFLSIIRRKKRGIS